MMNGSVGVNGWDSCESVVIKTGNVINNNDLLKRPGKTSADELWEGLKSAVATGEKTVNGNEFIIKSPDTVYTEEVDRNGLLTSVKIFMNSDSKTFLKEAIDKSLSYLEIPRLSNLVLAYHPEEQTSPLNSLKNLWDVLQEAVDEGLVEMIGLSDVDADVFFKLYEWARVKPSIIQISLAGCCIVPPPLQEFTKAHDIQLLTHSDPQETLPNDKMADLLPNFSVQSYYVAKFQAHIKCRGVLATKGYLLCAHTQ